MIRGKNYFNFDANRKPPGLNDLDDAAGFLDIQWGRFCASGEEEPVRNVIAALDFNRFTSGRGKGRQSRKEREKGIRERKNLSRVALWSLRSNCKIYPEILEIGEKIYNEKN